MPDKVRPKKTRKSSTAEQGEDGDFPNRHATTAVKVEEGRSRKGPTSWRPRRSLSVKDRVVVSPSIKRVTNRRPG